MTKIDAQIITFVTTGLICICVGISPTVRGFLVGSGFGLLIGGAMALVCKPVAKR